MRVLLQHSKTDPFGQGTHVVVADPTAVSNMIAYLQQAQHRKGGEPLFLLEGQALTVATLVQRVQRILQQAGVADPQQFKGHSFRRGGATSLHAAGVPDSLIKVMGRWHSFSFTRYIDTSMELLLDASRAMARATSKGKSVSFALPDDMPWDGCPWE
jgi:integrase